MESVIFLLLIPLMALGPGAVAIPILLLLLLAGTFFYWVATGRRHLCKAMAISLPLALVTLFAAAWPSSLLAAAVIGDGGWALGGTVAYIAAVLVFVASFKSQTAQAVVVEEAATAPEADAVEHPPKSTEE